MKRYLPVAALVASVLCALAAVPARAGEIRYTQAAAGSTLTQRQQTDEAVSDVYIYIGGAFPVGTHLTTFRYVFDLTTEGNTTGYITPLLFEFDPGESYTIFTIVGIGKGFEVRLNSAPQAIPFEIIEGIKVPTNAQFTFGFINALVDSSGSPIQTSHGVVDFDNPNDGGQGVGGPGSNNLWAASSAANPVATLGTTFGPVGSNADENFIQPYRTYSAQAIGVRAAQ
jgi:hypothetical protein